MSYLSDLVELKDKLFSVVLELNSEHQVIDDVLDRLVCEGYNIHKAMELRHTIQNIEELEQKIYEVTNYTSKLKKALYGVSKLREIEREVKNECE